MANQYCGLDVSPTSLKAVILEQTGDTPEVVTYDTVDFNEGTEEMSGEGEINRRVKEGLIEFSARHDLRGMFVSASLPTHTTFNRSISLPPVDDQRAEEIIQYEAQQHIPFPLENVIWDHQKVERDYEEGEEIDVVLFAIKKDIVNEFIGDLNDAGIAVDIIQFAPVALYNFLQYDQPVDTTTAVLDLGKNNCDLIIMEGGRYWIRDVPIAANDFTRAIQDKLQVSFDKAEQLKRNAMSSSDPKKFYKILQPVYRDLVQEIHRSIGFYKSKSTGSTIEQILLTGGGAKTIKLKYFISENMQLSASVVSSLERVRVKEGVSTRMNPTSVGPAVGLALQGMGRTRNEVNLLPERIVREKQLRKKKPYVITALVLFALAAGAYFVSIYLQESVYRTERKWATAAQEEVSTVRRELKKLEKESSWSSLKQIADQSVGFVPDRGFPVRLWQALNRAVPDNRTIRNELNALLVPFYKKAGENGVPETYADFRTMNPENLPGESLKDVLRKARAKERSFLFLLNVKLDYNKEERTTLDLQCAIVARESSVDEHNFVTSEIYDPIQGAFQFESNENTGAEFVRKVDLPDLLPGEGEDGGSGFDINTEKGQTFSVYRVHFEGQTSALKLNGSLATSSSNNGENEK